MYKCKQKDYGRRMLRQAAVDSSTWPNDDSRKGYVAQARHSDNEVFPRRANGNCWMEGACEPGNEVVVVSTVRSDGQVSNSGTGRTGDDPPVQGCSPTTLRKT